MNPIPAACLLWEENLPGGNHWSGRLRRGTALRLTDLQGGANVSALFYNAEQSLTPHQVSCQPTVSAVIEHSTRPMSDWHT